MAARVRQQAQLVADGKPHAHGPEIDAGSSHLPGAIPRTGPR